MLQIKTTGLSDYVDGSGNLKVLVIGGPGAGKTRSSSYWPKPIYADCENGRASIADRKVPYVEIKTSKDMLDFLAYLKSLESTPKEKRQFNTVVVDTLDGFQRKVQDEWLQQTQAGAFKGYDAWGYLDAKMSMLMTRLLNLDYNVVVLVHYKDKGKDDDSGREFELQLAGSIKNTAFNDFDLVGWLGTYWDVDPESGERVEKRGITFHRTPDKPFLKDRLAITPKWMPIEFDEQDYLQLHEVLNARLGDLPGTEEIGAVPDADDLAVKPAAVAPPTGGGPLPPNEKKLPLADMSKTELVEEARKLGLNPKGNALKAELIAQISAAAGQTGNAEVGPQEVPQTLVAGPESTAKAVATHDEAVALVATALGGEVIDSFDYTQTAVTAKEDAGNCEQCAASLQGENTDLVRLAFIKTRKKLCNACFKAQKGR